MRLLKEGLVHWADGTTASHLAKRAQGNNVLPRVQVRSPSVRNAAEACDFGVLVEKFY
jgi:hypothetical protein